MDTNAIFVPGSAWTLKGMITVSAPVASPSQANTLGARGEQCGLADRLEKRGVILRVAVDGDRRVKHLALTTEGATLRARLVRRVADGSTVTARLDPQERQQLSQLLDRLLH